MIMTRPGATVLSHLAVREVTWLSSFSTEQAWSRSSRAFCDIALGGFGADIDVLSLMVPELGRMASAMETFTLIVWMGVGAWAFEGNKTPSLTEDGCKMRAAVCYISNPWKPSHL